MTGYIRVQTESFKRQRTYRYSCRKRLRVKNMIRLVFGRLRIKCCEEGLCELQFPHVVLLRVLLQTGEESEGCQRGLI